MKTSKTTTVTFSLPTELNKALHAFVGGRGLSKFVAKAIEQALKEERMSLRKEYAEASKDPDRLKTIEDWKSLDVEGWD